MNTFPDEIYASRSPNTTLSTTGKVLLGLTGGLAVGLTVICAPFVSPALRKYCLPYIPATNTQVNNILTALQNRKGQLIDLGSGDGRIVFETAKNGFASSGVELNLWLVLYSKVQAQLNGLSKKTKFLRKDLWKFNLSQYDNIVIFGVEQM
ncbi:protein N-lysine methyltransferase FAM173B [Agrilus planipennis]|uniref:Protein N-lysine methyltransferase FAM173B n=1 Tax=Agrilus planipennis TaxID=224129 RepID=A0A1W4XU98_AGRPL|nr:protein N-lysine methyltransferase FAM173B [Agrilus planipennis]XP_025837569.1 protein N-lysine methyltransferase FAM173B [Agrilus planipennis]